MDHLAHHLDVLEARLTMDDASYASNCGSDSSCTSDSTAADDAAAADAFREFVYTSPKPGLQLPSTPLSALRTDSKTPLTSPLPLSPMGIGLTFPPISPISLSAPPPSPIGILDLSSQQQSSILSINTALSMQPVKQDHLDYEHFLSAAQPLSPARPPSSCSMTNSLSSSSLSSLSTSASYASSLASYASSYGAPPNAFPYNLASRPESPAQAQPIPAPVGLNPAHVNPGSLLLASPTKANYPHLQPGPAPSLALSQDGRASSPIPSPTSASAAITLIGVGSTPQQTQYNNTIRPTTPQTPVSATAALSLGASNSQVEDARAELQLQASAKRRREQSEQGNFTSDGDNIPVLARIDTQSGYNGTSSSSSSLASPSKRSATGSPEKRSTVSSSGGSAKGSNKTEIWPDDVEAAFMEGELLSVLPYCLRFCH